MKAFALTLALALTASAAHAQDTWTGPDKFLHFGGGALIAGAVTAGTQSRAWGFAAGCGVGLAKEVADPVFSQKDLVVTCLGAGLGAYATGWMIERQGRETVVSYTWEF
jgi:uncharacterized protein YfiM (DUF2279 family)